MVAVVTAVAVPGGLFSSANAGSTTPQISGSVAAPSASEISPVCAAADPTGVLGPTTAPPSNPTSTRITPSGGVVNFTANSTGIYVNTGSQVITYSLAGSKVSSFNLPSAIVNQNGNEVSQPVVDPSGDIYLSSYYNQVLDKFSPTGTLLWSVDPQGGNPTGIFSIGTGSNFEVAVTVGQNSSHSDLIDQSTGAVNGTFPLLDDFDYVTQESDGNLLFSGNGYVKTISPTGTVLSSFGSGQTAGRRYPHRFGRPVLLPGPGRPGPRRHHLLG